MNKNNPNHPPQPASEHDDDDAIHIPVSTEQEVQEDQQAKEERERLEKLTLDLEEGIFEGDEFTAYHEGHGAARYKIVGEGKDKQTGEPIYRIIDVSKGEKAKPVEFTFTELEMMLGEDGGRLVRSGDARLTERYNGATVSDALMNARKKRDNTSDDTPEAYALDTDINMLESRDLGQKVERAEKDFKKAGIDIGKTDRQSASGEDEFAGQDILDEQAGDRAALQALADTPENKRARDALKKQIDRRQKVIDAQNASSEPNSKQEQEQGSDVDLLSAQAEDRKKYSEMSDDEKQSDEGKALKEQIDQRQIAIDRENKRHEIIQTLEASPLYAQRSPEQQQAMRDMIDVLIAAGIIKTETAPVDPDSSENGTQETAEERAERERLEREAAENLQTQKDQIRETVESEQGAELEAALSDYAKALAAYETKGKRGHKRRERELHEAEGRLALAKIAQSKAVIEKWKESGVYDNPEGDEVLSEEALRQKQSDDMFDLMRTLGKQKRERTNELIEERNSKWYRRTGAKIGGWIDKSRALQFGFGFVGGALTSFGLLSSGAVWPIKAIGVGVAGFGVTQATRGLTRMSYNQNLLQHHRDGQGNALEAIQLTDAQIAEIKQKGTDQNGSIDEVGSAYATSMFDATRAKADTINQEIDKRGDKNAAVAGIGFAVGALTGAAGAALQSGFENVHANAGDGTGGESGGSGAGDGATDRNIDTLQENAKDHNNGRHGFGLDSAGQGQGGDVTQSTETFANYNTNNAPEHLLQDLLRETGNGNAYSEQLFHEIGNEVGWDNMFTTANGESVPVQNYGGDIGIGFERWDVDNAARLSDAAKAALAKHGVMV